MVKILFTLYQVTQRLSIKTTVSLVSLILLTHPLLTLSGPISVSTTTQRIHTYTTTTGSSYSSSLKPVTLEVRRNVKSQPLTLLWTLNTQTHQFWYATCSNGSNSYTFHTTPPLSHNPSRPQDGRLLSSGLRRIRRSFLSWVRLPAPMGDRGLCLSVRCYRSRGPSSPSNSEGSPTGTEIETLPRTMDLTLDALVVPTVTVVYFPRLLLIRLNEKWKSVSTTSSPLYVVFYDFRS